MRNDITQVVLDVANLTTNKPMPPRREIAPATLAIAKTRFSSVPAMLTVGPFFGSGGHRSRLVYKSFIIMLLRA